MAKAVITIEDAPDGMVTFHWHYEPFIEPGKPISEAQQFAIYLRKKLNKAMESAYPGDAEWDAPPPKRVINGKEFLQ